MPYTPDNVAKEYQAFANFIGRRIVEAREDLGLTRKELFARYPSLAKDLGLTDGYFLVHEIETGGIWSDLSPHFKHKRITLKEVWRRLAVVMRYVNIPPDDPAVEHVKRMAAKASVQFEYPPVGISYDGSVDKAASRTPSPQFRKGLSLEEKIVYLNEGNKTTLEKVADALLAKQYYQP